MNNLKNYNMTRKEFENAFMIPLQKEFGYISYWNSKELKSKNLNPISDSNVVGVCYTEREGRPIILRYRKDRVAEMLSTLIHEYAHAYLHCYGEDDEKLSSKIEEFEANKASFEVLNHFNINVENEKEIKYYYNKSSKMDKINYENLKRDWMLIDFKNRAVRAIEHNKSLLEIVSVNKNPIYKYKVECQLCKTSWRYTRKTKIIRENAEGYLCSLCGQKSLGQLIVCNL